MAKTNPNPISIELLKEFLRYYPETGELYWRPRDKKHFKSLGGFRMFQSKHAGQRVSSSPSRYGGGLSINIKKVRMKQHRVCWAIATGKWPPDMIDHINHDKCDNRIVNLRLATAIENSRNRRSQKNSTSRYVGVNWDKAHKRWKAQISNQGVKVWLGYFKSEEEAAKVRDAAAKEAYGEFANLNFKEVVWRSQT